jgi:hypothetical protein
MQVGSYVRVIGRVTRRVHPVGLDCSGFGRSGIPRHEALEVCATAPDVRIANGNHGACWDRMAWSRLD